MTALEIIAKCIRKEFYEDEHYHEMELRIITEMYAKDIIEALRLEGFTIIKDGRQA